MPSGNQISLVPLEIYETNQSKLDFNTRVNELYPQKGFPTPEIVSTNNWVKRFFLSQLRFFIKNKILLLGLVFVPFKKKINVLGWWINEWVEVSEIALRTHLMKDNYYSVPCRAIWKFIEVFLKEIGITNPLFPKMFAHLIEFDTAYRFRIEDIASEADVDSLYNNPRKEINRLLGIFTEREPIRPHLVAKFKYIALALSLALFSRRIKGAFRKALLAINFEDIQLDEADRYHVLRLAGYQFLGRPIEDRIQEYVKLHNGNPPQTIRVQGK